MAGAHCTYNTSAKVHRDCRPCKYVPPVGRQGSPRNPDAAGTLRLGWVPYYYMDDYGGLEFYVYRQAPGGALTAVNLPLRQRLLELAQTWDRDLLMLDVQSIGVIDEVGSSARQLELF